jgi:hypothetical protein
MPPQQPERLLDGFDRRLDFGAHANSPDFRSAANLAQILIVLNRL